MALAMGMALYSALRSLRLILRDLLGHKLKPGVYVELKVTGASQ